MSRKGCVAAPAISGSFTIAVGLSILSGGLAGPFRPYGESLFWQTPQKSNQKNAGLHIRPLRCAAGFPRSGLAPGRTALYGPSWPAALAGHPWPSPPFARPALGLLSRRWIKIKSRSRARLASLAQIKSTPRFAGADQERKSKAGGCSALSLLCCAHTPNHIAHIIRHQHALALIADHANRSAHCLTLFTQETAQ